MKLFQIIFISSLFIFFLSSVSYSQCTVTATNINFGNYDVASNTNLTSSGTITVSCRNDRNVVIAFGQSANGGINPRRMKHSFLNDFLNYNIYQDAATSIIWGDGSNGTSPMIVNRIPRNRTFTYYGVIFAGQDISAGTYTDSLIVTVTP